MSDLGKGNRIDLNGQSSQIACFKFLSHFRNAFVVWTESMFLSNINVMVWFYRFHSCVQSSRRCRYRRMYSSLRSRWSRAGTAQSRSSQLQTEIPEMSVHCQTLNLESKYTAFLESWFQQSVDLYCCHVKPSCNLFGHHTSPRNYNLKVTAVKIGKLWKIHLTRSHLHKKTVQLPWQPANCGSSSEPSPQSPIPLHT